MAENMQENMQDNMTENMTENMQENMQGKYAENMTKYAYVYTMSYFRKICTPSLADDGRPGFLSTTHKYSQNILMRLNTYQYAPECIDTYLSEYIHNTCSNTHTVHAQYVQIHAQYIFNTLQYILAPVTDISAVTGH